MQMPTALDRLQLRLVADVNAWIEQGRDIMAMRQSIRDQIMSHYPQYYSWSNRNSDHDLQVEIFDRSNGAQALISLVFRMPQTKKRP